MNRKIRYRINGKWSNWGDFGSLHIPDETDAVEFSEYLTAGELKLQNPKWYKEYVEQYGERG